MPRVERGGKKTAKSKELSEATLKAQQNPKSAPTSETSRKRLEGVAARVALERTKAQASSSASNSAPLPVESSERVAETVVKEPQFLGFGTNPVCSKPLLMAPIPEILGWPRSD